MKKVGLFASSIVVVGLCAGSASADVYFSDDFEGQTIPLGPPDVGFGYTLSGTTGEPFSLSTSPAIDTTSLKLIREGIANPSLNALSVDSTMVSGNVIEFSWSNYQEHTHAFNAPIQVQIGMVNGLVGRLAFLGVNDPGNGSYFYTDANGFQIATGIKPTLNGWDRVRAVLTLEFFEGGTTDFMTGTMDMFISLNGGAEQQVANDVGLAYGEIPTDNPQSPDWDESTAALMRIQKGPSTGTTYYDNLYIGAPVTPATASTWNVNADGNWSAAGNWSGPVPNGVGAVAGFGTIITSARTVTIDAPQTVGTLSFDNANSYTIAGTSTLTIDVSSGSGAIKVIAGSHSIAAPIVLADNTAVDVTAGQALSVQHLRGAGLTINTGTVKMIAGGSPNSADGASKLTAVTVASGAVLDLTNNSLVIDYTGTSVQDGVRQALADGRLTTSLGDANKKLGYGEASVTGFANGTFAGQSVDADAVLVKFTYGGDSNLDGKVDVGDLGNLASNWQQSAPWTGGDFDYNGTVNVGDLGILATNWQQGVTTPTLGPSFQEALAALGLPGVSVPEPATAGLLALVLPMIAAHRTRRR